MAAVINTNISSLNAQRNLTTSQSSLATSLQRLSSGLRINSAKDDAAGLAISERFNSQIRGLTQAARNANDGISLAQTAEGALGQIGDALQRIRELSVQSANATNSSSDRAALQQEVSQLVSEISRIGDTTSFNGLKILDGSYTNQQYQVGANAGETIAVSVGDSRSSKLGATTLSSSTGMLSSVSLNQALTINGTAIESVAGAGTTGATSMSELINVINAKSGTTGVTASRATTNTLTSSGNYVAADTTLTINGTAVSLVGATDTNAAAAVAKINAVSVQTGVTATATGEVISFSSANGADFTLQSSVAATIPGVGTTAATYTAGISLAAKLGTEINATGALAGATALNLPATAGTTDQKDFKVSTMDISTVDGANKALAAADFALTQINSTRAQLGAIQNRFSAVVTNLNAASENFSASRSRILDTDFAAETANMTRGQILQQAGTAMLAQANSLPNGVLALLRG
ncbi:flagellin [Oxalobacteraceae bacterium R-40]|uniref:Flagellin n=1 Tax=Keguizhuia sedimenti TaxID=3064264 RepID=A0ABU1BP64_9BURK|nr:flagellin [Oxalobacteraceae bacterium R-40]